MRTSWVVLLLLTALELGFSALGAADADSTGSRRLTIEGVVSDALRRPLSGAKLTLKGRGSPSVLRHARSGPDGGFAFANVAAGTYAVIAEKSGFRTATVILTIAPGSKPKLVVLSLESEQALSVGVSASRLSSAPNRLSPTGNSAYTFTRQDIDNLPQGQDTTLEALLTQMPGVSQSVDGRVHIRGAQANFQYVINGIVLPFDTNSGFGQFLTPRFFDSVSLQTGILAPEYGFRTSGVIDIKTKEGCAEQGGNAEMYGGQRDTVMPNFELGGCHGNFSYYLTGFYQRDNLAFSQATPGPNPIHDLQDQGQGFGYLSYTVSPAVHLSLIAGTWVSSAQFPNWPGQEPAYQLEGVNPADHPSIGLNNTLFQQEYFAAIALQGALSPNLSYNIAYATHYVTLAFSPDDAGDLLYQGVASNEFHSDFANTLQADLTYRFNEAHTVKTGFYIGEYGIELDDTSLVFPANSQGQQTSNVPITVVDNLNKINWLFGVYAEDLWQISKKFTLSYGLRWDAMESFADESQISPRVNLAYTPQEGLVFHAGYARYFATPEFESITTRSAEAFAGTTQAITVPTNFNIYAERDNYFDAGVVDQPLKNLTLSEDAYFILASDALGAGQFGAVPIISPYNYQSGRTWGAESSISYRFHGIFLNASFTYLIAQANNLITQQYNFPPDQLAYVAGHYIPRSQAQVYTSSGQVGYRWRGWLFTADSFYGSGLWGGFANTFEFPPTWQVDAAVAHSLTLPGIGQSVARLMVINVFDRTNLLQNGTGLGVFAPAYLPRLAVYGALRVPLPFGNTATPLAP
jgi:hypothetical protein